jgi:RimJ/RimL family protein N-acetyltransferase
MSRLFPRRIETDRLVLERLSHDGVDCFELYEFVSREDWRGAATEHMPWFRLDRIDQVAAFVDGAEQQWVDRERARYLLRSPGADGDIVGMAAFDPEWEASRAGSDVVLAEEYWGRGYGGERASVFVELAFERYDLDAYVTDCAVDNEPSRRMLSKVVERYGGQHEGVVRHHSSPRPDGTVTDQHRFSILREEYEAATEGTETLAFTTEW